MKRVLVLGCGPSGLLCAHAAMIEGHNVSIISKKEPSFIAGAQYLHSRIPDITNYEPDGELDVIKVGTPDVYAEKVYGNPTFQTSWDKFPAGPTEIWNLRVAYKKLWDLYEERITDGYFDPRFMDIAMSEFDVIFSTIPLKVIFPGAGYTFKNVWIEERGDTPNMFIMYDGTWLNWWYRASCIFGNAFAEYPVDIGEKGRKIAKPLDNTVHNPHERLFLFGRYGQWKKGVLVDDAFREAWAVSREVHSL